MGLAIIAVGLALGGLAGWAIAAFGLLPLATGAAGVCPISPLVGEPFRSAGCASRPSRV